MDRNKKQYSDGTFQSYSGFRKLTNSLLTAASTENSRISFTDKALQELTEFFNCSFSEIVIREIPFSYTSTYNAVDELFRFKIFTEHDLDRFESVLGHIDSRYITGLFNEFKISSRINGDYIKPYVETVSVEYKGSHYNAVLLLPLKIRENCWGCIAFLGEKFAELDDVETEKLETLQKSLSLMIAYQKTQHALQERIKELTCLYKISKTVSDPDADKDGTLYEIMNHLRQAMQYPNITACRITIDGEEYITDNFRPSTLFLKSDIMIKDNCVGSVEVFYITERENKWGPFIPEEITLLDAVAKEIGDLVEKRKTAQEKFKLQKQLQHSDRLATIGNLASGLAHELNEPLSSILGFAELAKKASGIPESVDKDLEKIISASLHSRDIVKKLLIFGSQLPPSKDFVNLNELINDSLVLLENRFAKGNIIVTKNLYENLPTVRIDSLQIKQVVINLVLNAIQAMPDGGELQITTKNTDKFVYMVFEDSGIGMTKDIKDKIFDPFFTTKPVEEGTGLGLPVVHGIIQAHDGSILVETCPGKGSTFEIKLPRSE